MKKNFSEYEIKLIQVLINAMKTKTLLCNVESVSKSGLTRKLNFLTIQGNSVWRFNILFAKLGYKLDKNKNVIVSGCGMDMVWHTIYDVSHTLSDAGFISSDELQELSQTSAVIV